MGMKDKRWSWMVCLLCFIVAIGLLSGCGLSKEQNAQKKRNERIMEPKCVALLDEKIGKEQYCLRKFSQLTKKDKYKDILCNQYNVLFEKDGKSYTYGFLVNSEMEIVDSYTNLYTENIKKAVWQFLKAENFLSEADEVEMRFSPAEVIGDDLIPEGITTFAEYVAALRQEETVQPLPVITFTYYNKKTLQPEEFPVQFLFEKFASPQILVLNKDKENGCVYDQIEYIRENGIADEKKILANYQHIGVKGTEDYRFLYNDHFYDAKIYFKDQTFDITMLKMDFYEPVRQVSLENQMTMRILEEEEPKMILCWEPLHQEEVLLDDGTKSSYDMNEVTSMTVFDGSIREDVLQDRIYINKKGDSK